jgi:hypothetical protein
MRAITFLLTFTLVFCGASVVGPTDNLPSLPSAGLFVLDRAPAAVDASIVVASR